jgi:hypothetical protein
MYPRPFHSIGLLFRLSGDQDPVFLGTCFAYRTKRTFLTVAHCVGRLQALELRVVLPITDHADFIEVTGLAVHPTADLAVLTVAPIASDELLPFAGREQTLTWGDDAHAVGFPEESEGHGVVPTARYHSGNIQRFFTHRSSLGYVYRAGELSFGAAAGLSGGPVFPPEHLDKVIGVVAENHDSTTYLRSVEEVQEDGQIYRQRLHEVIRYGIFVSLNTKPVAVWLDRAAEGAA